MPGCSWWDRRSHVWLQRESLSSSNSFRAYLIVRAHCPAPAELALLFREGPTSARRYVHRHAAFLVPDLPALKQRLQASGVEILFDPAQVAPDDTLAQNLITGCMRMYNSI